MDKQQRRKTPLGERFDQADFPFDPAAWSEMEQLLANQPPQMPTNAPLSIVQNLGWLCIAALLGIGFWWANSVAQPSKAVEITSVSPPTSANNAAFLPKISQLETPQTAENTPLSKTPDFLNLKTPQITDNQQIKTLNKTDFQPTIFVKTSAQANQNNFNTEGGKNTLSKQTLSTTTPQIPTQNTDFAPVQTVFSDVLNTQILSKPIANDLTQATETANLDAPPSVLKTDNSAASSLPQQAEQIDNQPITTESAHRQASESPFLSLLLANAIASNGNQKYEDIGRVQAEMRSKTLLKPNTWRGKHHQITAAFGRGLSVNYETPPLLSRFRLGYAYRFSNWMSVGASTSYSTIALGGKVFSTDAEANFHFLNRRRLDFYLSAGFGYRYWDFTARTNENFVGEGRSVMVGLNIQYRFRYHYVLGMRGDVKDVAAGRREGGVMLFLGKQF
jgi:opacity protein-like surface antigen